MNEELEVPTFTYGSYPSSDGTPVNFTDDFMRQLERNTNRVIDAKVLTPPVEYDWIDDRGYHHGGLSAVAASERTDAHGQIKRVKFEKGVLSLVYTGLSNKFRDDVKAGRRVRTSGVFVPNYWFNDAQGNKVEVGPTIVGTAVLGAKRPAMRNPKIVPLQDLKFGEGISAFDAWEAKEKLRASGFVAQTFDEDTYCFSEIEVSPSVFAEGETHMPLTADELKQIGDLAGNAATAAANAAVKPLTDAITSMQSDIKKFGEGEQRKSNARAFCEKLAAERKEKGAPLPKTYLEKAEAFLSKPSLSDGDLVDARQLVESAPGAFVTAGRSDDDKGEGAAKEEPKALATLRPRHFSQKEDPQNQVLITDGLRAFAEFKPDAFKGIESNPQAQERKLFDYISARDNGIAVAN